MRITHYTIRDIKALDGVPASKYEWDVVAKRDDGVCLSSRDTFDSVDKANALITAAMIEPLDEDYWEYLDAMHVNRIPHDAWIMVPALEEEPDDTPAHIPHPPPLMGSEAAALARWATRNPPVSGYDEAPEEGEGEKAGRMAYIATQKREPTLEEVAAYVKAQTRDQTEVLNEKAQRPKDYEASPCVLDPDNYWVDDETGERIYALNGERTPAVVYGALLGAKIVELQASNERYETMRHAIYHSDAEIKVRDDDFTGDNVITLWKIRGVPKTFYPSKMAAEVAARAHFPHDQATVRYSRISFIEVDYDFNFGEEV